MRRVPDVSHLSRAGRLAVGTALAAALALPACGGGNPDTKAPDPTPEENIAPPYGVPPDRDPPPPDENASDAGNAETPDPPNDVPAAMYGVPVQ